MTLNLQLPKKPNLKPAITVFGVGGAGGNAVNNMISAKVDGITFVVANTDAQALDQSLAENKIQLGEALTQGLGAGSYPEVGRAAAEEACDEILDYIQGSNMIFITAGMGGGTGTGAAPVVARLAREQGILTVAVVTKPFQFEGAHRNRIAEQGIQELQKYVDTLIVTPNQNLFRVVDRNTTFKDAFKMADDVLRAGVQGVTDLMVMPGLINLDFADIRSVMGEMGRAMMGTGQAQGENRSIKSAEAAISNPLLDNASMKGARGVLINITGGQDLTLFEVDEAASRIRDEVDPDANIIFGSTFDPALEGTIRVSVVATGIDLAGERIESSAAPAKRYIPMVAEPQEESVEAAAIDIPAREEAFWANELSRKQAKFQSLTSIKPSAEEENEEAEESQVNGDSFFTPQEPLTPQEQPVFTTDSYQENGALSEAYVNEEELYAPAASYESPSYESEYKPTQPFVTERYGKMPQPQQQDPRSEPKKSLNLGIFGLGNWRRNESRPEESAPQTVDHSRKPLENPYVPAYASEKPQEFKKDYIARPRELENASKELLDVPAFLRRKS